MLNRLARHTLLPGFAAAFALALAAQAPAGMLNEDFESYTVGQPLDTQSVYASDATVTQNAGDPVNPTKVMEQNGTGTNTPTTYLDLSGEVQFSLDLNLGGADGFTQIYLFQDSSNRPLWVQFIHDSTDGNKALVGQEGSAALWPSLGSFQTGQWYRLTATVSVNTSNGNLTTASVQLHELDAGGVLGDLVGSVSDVNVRGAPTQVNFASIANSAGTSGRYDNWTAVVPEPASATLLGLGALVALRRR